MDEKLFKSSGITFNEDADDMRRALNIEPDRCDAICDAVDETQRQHPKWHMGKVLSHVRKEKTLNDNEFAFTMYMYGRHTGICEGLKAGVQVGETIMTFRKMMMTQSPFRVREDQMS